MNQGREMPTAPWAPGSWQQKQRMQTLRSTSGKPPLIEMALGGQELAHTPQPTHMPCLNVGLGFRTLFRRRLRNFRAQRVEIEGDLDRRLLEIGHADFVEPLAQGRRSPSRPPGG